jgi:hypothetical protein
MLSSPLTNRLRRLLEPTRRFGCELRRHLTAWPRGRAPSRRRDGRVARTACRIGDAIPFEPTIRWSGLILSQTWMTLNFVKFMVGALRLT